MARPIPLAPAPARGAPRLLVCVALLAAVALAACGGDDDDAGSAKTSELSSITALTESQYTQIKRVYVASLPLDDLDDPTRRAYKRAVRDVVGACERLDASSPLLGAMRRACPVTAEFFHTVTSTAECRGREACIDAFEAAEKGARRVIAANRASDKAINATRLPQACKRPLLTSPETYAQASALERGLGMVARALKTASQQDDMAALRVLRAADAEPDGPTQQENLNLLRRNCH